ncbi:MAG: hypothetical protein HUU34_08480 [Saprospiraceae bacterium]|nr:hypothetical protein [Saprospiraceae bacterium]
MKTTIFFFKKSAWCLLLALATACSSNGQPAKADDLIGCIKKAQVENVRESCNQMGCCCFTDLDLAEFQRSKTADVVAKELRSSGRFKSIIAAIKELSPQEWGRLRAKALATRRPTWAEQGSISCSGQTNAGRDAEQMIAQSVIALVDEMLK